MAQRLCGLHADGIVRIAEEPAQERQGRRVTLYCQGGGRSQPDLAAGVAEHLRERGLRFGIGPLPESLRGGGSDFGVRIQQGLTHESPSLLSLYVFESLHRQCPD